VELPPNLPATRGDRVQLQQVLLNLLINSADSMSKLPPEQRRLQVRARHADDHTVEMVVSDSGHGIPSDRLPHIFEPFFTTKSTGLGIGLAITQAIVNTHGGRIWAENNPGGGASFRFTLPTTTTTGGQLE
jgi:C4-dicarboxylate-specific signal transduction histidine kinase